MFQDYGKQAWRLSSIGLLLGCLVVFSVAAFAILQPVSKGMPIPVPPQPLTINPIAAKNFGPWILPPFLRNLIGVHFSVNSDGNFRITTLGHQQSRRSILLSLEPDLKKLTPPLAGGHYITLNSIGDSFELPGTIQRTIPGQPGSRSLVEIGRVGGRHFFQAHDPGYFRIKIDNAAGGDSWYNLFVSPVPSFHLDRTDRDWYMTQWNTETTSNCGPTVAAMAVRWASDAQPDVLAIRQYLGWTGDGAVSIGDLLDVLHSYNIKSRILEMNSTADIFAALDKGHLVGVVYDMAGLPGIDNPDRDFMGQYYTDRGGHYLAIKGYSLDRKWFIIYDPIPSDWAENRLRYPDGITMIGRNRYYDTKELWRALRSTEALEISR